MTFFVVLPYMSSSNSIDITLYCCLHFFILNNKFKKYVYFSRINKKIHIEDCNFQSKSYQKTFVSFPWKFYSLFFFQFREYLMKKCFNLWSFLLVDALTFLLFIFDIICFFMFKIYLLLNLLV